MALLGDDYGPQYWKDFFESLDLSKRKDSSQETPAHRGLNLAEGNLWLISMLNSEHHLWFESLLTKHREDYRVFWKGIDNEADSETTLFLSLRAIAIMAREYIIQDPKS